MVAHAVDPSTQEAEERCLCEFEVSLVYRVNSRTARATQRKTKQNKQTNKTLGSIGKVKRRDGKGNEYN